MIDRKARDIWDAALGQLELRVTRPSFETWLKDTLGVSFVDDVLTVGTPSTFAAEMLGNRMYSLISESVDRTVKGSVEVRFRVLQRGHFAEDLIEGEIGELSNSAPPYDSHSREGSSFKVNGKFTFENFVVGNCNALAHAAARAVAEQPGTDYNPLFIYSGVGLGKTHLLHAIGQRARLKGHSLIYTSTEQFTNEYIMAIRNRNTDDFREKYRKIDVLLLDDIQFIMGKEQTQEGFFHTFNALHMDNRQIVVTSDRPARLMSNLTDRIRSRLEGGLVVDIQPPGLETRLAILKSKAEKQRVQIAEDIFMLLAEVSPRNIRELEGNLNRVVAYSQLTQTPITMEFVKHILADILVQQSSTPISEQDVLDTVAAYFSTDPKLIVSRRRDKKTSLARHITMYLLRLEMNKQFAEIGRIMGGKDHTTVIHACNKISSLINSDSGFRKDVLKIRSLLQDKTNA